MNCRKCWEGAWGRGGLRGEPEAELNPRRRMWCEDPGPGAFSREAEASPWFWTVLGAVCASQEHSAAFTEMPWS